MKQLEIPATLENLEEVMSFIDAAMEEVSFPMKTALQIDVAVEEIFVNIASYAYVPDVGKADITIDFENDPLTAVITFKDRGTPYDPLKKEDPDVTLSAEEREIGGLGIYMVKKTMDDVFYKRENDQNIFIMKKKAEP